MNNPHIQMHQSPNLFTAEHKASLGHHILFNATNILAHGLTHNISQSRQTELHNSSMKREDQLFFSVICKTPIHTLNERQILVSTSSWWHPSTWNPLHIKVVSLPIHLLTLSLNRSSLPPNPLLSLAFILPCLFFKGQLGAQAHSHSPLACIALYTLTNFSGHFLQLAKINYDICGLLTLALMIQAIYSLKHWYPLIKLHGATTQRHNMSWLHYKQHFVEEFELNSK